MTKRRADRRAAAAEAEESAVEYSSDEEGQEEREPLPDRLEELRKLAILTGLLLWATWNLPILSSLIYSTNATLSFV